MLPGLLRVFVLFPIHARSRAVDRAEVDAVVRPKVVEDVALEDVRHGHDRALRVRRVVVARTRDGDPRREEVHLAVRVREAEQPPGDDGDGVGRVVDPCEVGDLREKEQLRRTLVCFGIVVVHNEGRLAKLFQERSYI